MSKFESWFAKFKKRPNDLQKGAVGIYQDKFTMYTDNDSGDKIKEIISVKVKVIEVYDEIVEVEVVDVYISESTNEDIAKIIKNCIPKYMNPKFVNWQIKNK